VKFAFCVHFCYGFILGYFYRFSSKSVNGEDLVQVLEGRVGTLALKKTFSSPKMQNLGGAGTRRLLETNFGSVLIIMYWRCVY